MLLDELVEIVGQNLAGQPPRAGVDRHLRHLQQQAFPQVAGADAGRLQLMDDVQQAFQLSGRGLDPHREGDVVGHGFQVAAQVTVLVDAPDQVDGQPHIPLGKIPVAQLFDQILLQRTPLGQIDRALFVVFRKVVDAAFVRRRVVVVQVFVNGDLLGLLVVLGRAFLLFQNDVVLDLLFDALFELHGGELQQLDHLNLLRRELLLKRKYLFLIDSHIGSKLRIYQHSEFGLFIYYYRVRVSRKSFKTASGVKRAGAQTGFSSPKACHRP